jgi:hypothetical protein
MADAVAIPSRRGGLLQKQSPPSIEMQRRTIVQAVVAVLFAVTPYK